MIIKFKLFSGYNKYVKNLIPGNDRMISLDLEEGTSILGLISSLGIPEIEVKIILVNHRHKGMDYIIQDGDEISIFPPIAGG